MDKKFLHRVLDQIVYETDIDHEKKKIYFPFSSSSSYHFNYRYFPPRNILPVIYSFTKHCEDIYGLNKSEIDYVWKEYISIITN